MSAAGCILCGGPVVSRYTGQPGGLICDRDWFRLPLPVRVDWWEATSFGRVAPPLPVFRALVAASDRARTER